MVNAASALGEAVGNLIEKGMNEVIDDLIKIRGYKRGKKRIRDKAGIEFQIDAPIYDEKNGLIALIDIKYLRYKKHGRDKGSWVIVAHARLKATYPTIRKSMVILLGPGWSESTKKLIETSGVNVVSIDPALVSKVLSEYNINFNWEEDDDFTPKESWAKYQRLSDTKKQACKSEILRISDIKKILDKWLNDRFPKKTGPMLELTCIAEDKSITPKGLTSGRE